ncbi:hypothetical protein [Acetobacter oeni]|uniref:hypothetical protein n=1 Tax=Acetobacter oeni TaxID=304077 RepID=UPI00156A154B|nr:hypothetical protein [Acetobacter oeni]
MADGTEEMRPAFYICLIPMQKKPGSLSEASPLRLVATECQANRRCRIITGRADEAVIIASSAREIIMALPVLLTIRRPIFSLLCCRLCAGL